MKNQKIKSVESHKDYDEYRAGLEETAAANPDGLSESEGMYQPTDPELSNSVKRLVQKAKTELTPLQFKLFSLLTGLDGRPPLSIRDTGAYLKIHPSRVQRMWEIVRERVQEIYERH